MNLVESMATFFLGKKEDPKEITVDGLPSFEKPIDPDGGVVTAGGIQQANIAQQSSSNDKDLIEQYRAIARIPEVNEAIDEIVNEMLSEDSEGNIIDINTEEVDISEQIKKAIAEEFKNVLSLMDFDQRGHEILKRWYVDGRIAYHKVVDKKKLSDGIKELRYINPVSLEKVVEYDAVKEGGMTLYKTSKEYFKFTPGNRTNAISLKGNSAGNGNSASFTNFWASTGSSIFGDNQVLAISPDAIAFCTSGQYNEDFGSVTSYLHPIIKVANNLSNMEDSLVIYRTVRATERRLFYVDVGNLPKLKGEQYMADMMNKFKTNISYDSTTGAIRGGSRFQSMMEDFWIPRRENGRSTEITTLPGGQNLGSMDDVEYFIKKLYSALKIPYSRFNKDQPVIAGLGRSSEITRDEIRFQKFIDRLRKKFTLLFNDVLGTQLVLKKVMSRSEWNEISKNIRYVWARDSFFTESKEGEILRDRLSTLQLADPYIGKYFTTDFVLKSILKVPEDEFEALKKDLDKEQETQAADEYDAAIQNNDIAVDKAEKMAAIQQNTGD